MLTIPKTRRGAPVKPSHSVLNQIGSLCFKSASRRVPIEVWRHEKVSVVSQSQTPMAGHQRFRVKRGFHLERPSLASCAAFFP
jgi:hypothetical protein